MALRRAVGDNSRANTIDDKTWSDIQDRARKRNPERERFGSDEQVRAGRRGRDNLHQTWKGNN